MTDRIRRDDLKPATGAEAFAALPPPVRAALRRAATRRAAPLPVDMGQGWIMVPTRSGLVQVAFDGFRAFSL